MSRSTNGLLQINPQKKQIDLIALIERVMNFLKPGIEFKELEVSTEFESDTKMVLAEIEDTGIGMDSYKVNKLFTYIQSKDRENNSQKGSGLELLLSKEFLDKNNATIDIDSEPGEGNKVIISL